MENKKSKREHLSLFLRAVTIFLILTFSLVISAGCNMFSGYSSESLYPENVRTIYVEMIQSQSFKRGTEYDITDALAKRIEISTPYKIVSSRDRADSVISGQLVSSGSSIMVIDRETGSPLEQGVEVTVVVNWKNLKTGELLIDNKSVTGAATYSHWQSQGIEYGMSLAANRVAGNIVELMEKEF